MMNWQATARCGRAGGDRARSRSLFRLRFQPERETAESESSCGPDSESDRAWFYSSERGAHSVQL